MDSFYHAILGFFRHADQLGAWAYLAVFILTFVESFAFIGALIPGTPVIIFLGFIASKGHLNIGLLLVLATLGGILGDNVSYYLGTKGVRLFGAEKKILKLNHLERGKKFFARHGDKSIFFSRFIGPIRPVVPFLAGLADMNRKTFFFWNVVSSTAWSLFYVYMGYFFGGALTRSGSLLDFFTRVFHHIFGH